MLQYWHILGREAVYYRSMIDSLKDDFLENHCQICKSDEELTVIEEMSLYDIMLKFRVKLAGLIPTKEEFVTFYEKK